jgi:hypothetical protein
MNGFRFVWLLSAAALIYFGGVAVVKFYSTPEFAPAAHAAAPHTVLPSVLVLVGGVALAGYCVVVWIASVGPKPRRRFPVSPPMEPLPAGPTRQRTLADVPPSMLGGGPTGYGASDLGPTGRPLHGIAVDRPIYGANGNGRGKSPQTVRSAPPLPNPYDNDEKPADPE